MFMLASEVQTRMVPLVRSALSTASTSHVFIYCTLSRRSAAVPRRKIAIFLRFTMDLGPTASEGYAATEGVYYSSLSVPPPSIHTTPHRCTLPFTSFTSSTFQSLFSSHSPVDASSSFVAFLSSFAFLRVMDFLILICRQIQIQHSLCFHPPIHAQFA